MQTLQNAVLGERDAAKYIGYSTAYLRVARRKGTGPAYIRIGRSIRYSRKDLDTWLYSHRVETAVLRCACGGTLTLDTTAERPVVVDGEERTVVVSVLACNQCEHVEEVNR